MNIVASTWKYKCPRCRKGDLYEKPFDISKPIKMNERCSHCDLKFEAEPGYFFGAMFISYIWTGFACLAVMATCLFVFNLSVNASFIILVLTVLAAYFFILRISRSMYIHMDVPYDKKYAENNIQAIEGKD